MWWWRQRISNLISSPSSSPGSHGKMKWLMSTDRPTPLHSPSPLPMLHIVCIYLILIFFQTGKPQLQIQIVFSLVLLTIYQVAFTDLLILKWTLYLADYYIATIVMSLYRSKHNYDITNLLAIILLCPHSCEWSKNTCFWKIFAATQQQPQHLWHHKYIQVKLFRSI